MFLVLPSSYISHTFCFRFCQDQSETSSQTETSKASLDDNESNEDKEVAVDEVNKDKTSVDDSDLAESGKKDPLVRRQELLINSGLAEVCCFTLPFLNFFCSDSIVFIKRVIYLFYIVDTIILILVTCKARARSII